MLGVITHFLSGGALGVFGAIGSGVLDFFKTKEANKQELAVLAARQQIAATEATSQAGLEALKLIGASYAQDAAAYTGELSWVDMLRGSLRPIVTYFLLAVSTCLAFWAFQRVVLEIGVVTEIAKYAVFTCLDLTSMCISWYFGARQIDKINRATAAPAAAKKK